MGRQKRYMDMELEILIVPEANLEERRKLLLTMLDGVYVDSKEERP